MTQVRLFKRSDTGCWGREGLPYRLQCELKDVGSRHPSGIWRTCLKWNLHNERKADTDIIGKPWHLLANLSGFSATLLISSTSNRVLSIHSTCQGACFTIPWISSRQGLACGKITLGSDPRKPEGGSGKSDMESQYKSVLLNWSPLWATGTWFHCDPQKSHEDSASELLPSSVSKVGIYSPHWLWVVLWGVAVHRDYYTEVSEP